MRTTKAKVENQIVNLNNQWNRASLKMDIKTLALLYSDDCVFHFPNGTIEDKKWVMNLLSSGEVSFEKIKNHDVRLRVYGATVLWTSKTALTETYKGQHSQGEYLWLRLWRHSGRRWQIVAFQSTPCPSSTS